MLTDTKEAEELETHGLGFTKGPKKLTAAFLRVGLEGFGV